MVCGTEVCGTEFSTTTARLPVEGKYAVKLSITFLRSYTPYDTAPSGADILT